MKYSIIVSATALVTSVAAVPYARPHAHIHAQAHAQRAVVTHVVTVTADGPKPTPKFQSPHMDLAAANNGPPANGGPPGQGNQNCGTPAGFNGYTPGGFTPCGFTPRVTATGAAIVTLPNGQKSVSHLEQTLGLSTAARSQPSGGPVVAPNSNGGPGDPVSFPKNPSTGGPPTHAFEVIVNEPAQPGGRDYPGTILLQTNFHRRNQSAPDVIWGFALQRSAQDQANKCVYQQDLSMEGGGYGQGIVAGIPGNEVGKVISDTFYNSQVNAFQGLYGQANPDMSDFNNWGFFTQMVWKATSQIGCYSVDCSSKGGLKGKPAGASDDFTVCNFWPAGNVAGEYAANVGQPGDYPPMNWDDSTWSQVAGNGKF